MEKLKGGLADKKTVEDIARKHSVFVGTIIKALQKGIKVESEHTTDKDLQEEIAKDHLWEDPDYYEKLEKMEKGKKEETKECTGADASGSFEAPIFGKVIKKKDIYKLHNSKKLNEVADASISAGAMYDAPIGHKPKDPLDIDNPNGSTGTIMGNKKMDSKSIAVTKKNFPKFGGPESKFVSIDAKQTFPYSNQGDPKNSSLYEIKGMKEAIETASKKYGLTIVEIENMIVAEAYNMPGVDFSPATKWGKQGNDIKYEYHLISMDSKEQQPAPLDFTTKDEDVYHKLKAILMANGTRFKEDKRPITNDEQLQAPPKEEESLYIDDNDPDFEEGDDIFANMKK